MKRTKRKMPSDFNLYLIGDWHVGNVAFARERLKKDIARIKRDKMGYVGLMGDLAESIHLGDKRYDPSIHHSDKGNKTAGRFETADQQAGEIAKMLYPIKDRILWYLTGNHEEKIAKTANSANMVVRTLGVDIPVGFSVKIELTPKLKVFAIHGAGVVRSRAGDRKQVETNDGITLKRRLKDLMGDCMLMAMGHIHSVRICSPEPHLMLVDDGDGELKGVYAKASVSPEGVVAVEDRYYCSTGSYLRGFMDGVTTYSERAMYPPCEIGGVRCEIREDELVGAKKWV